MRIQSVAFNWIEVEVHDRETGELRRAMAMVPLRRYDNVSKRQFGEAGSEHVLGPIEQRNMRFHNAAFAELHEYWLNLPENIAARWPTEDHFRPWLLIECGFFHEKEFDLTSEKHARALAAFIRTEQPYARIAIRGTMVIVRVAESQAVASMKGDRFKESMSAILELASSFVGVSPAQMRKHAGRHA